MARVIPHAPSFNLEDRDLGLSFHNTDGGDLLVKSWGKVVAIIKPADLVVWIHGWVARNAEKAA